MFDNRIDSVYEDSQLRKSHHNIGEIQWSELNTAQKCLLSTICFLIAYHLIRKLKAIVKEYYEDSG